MWHSRLTDVCLGSYYTCKSRQGDGHGISVRHCAALLVALVAGCATTWQVDNYQAPGSDITARRSFAWKGGELGTVAEVNPAVATATDLHLREVIVAGLVRKGYQEAADAKSAQMLVSYQVAGTRKYETPEITKVQRAQSRTTC